MSESVKIGGIGKNPIIDKINRLDSVNIKIYAEDKLERLLLLGKPNQNVTYGKAVPLDFKGMCRDS